jgi:hypothetical protein
MMPILMGNPKCYAAVDDIELLADLKLVGFLSRDSPDDSRTGVNIRAFPAS